MIRTRQLPRTHKHKSYKIRRRNISMSKRTMPVCFTAEQYARIEKIAKEHGMTNASQAIEKLLEQI